MQSSLMHPRQRPSSFLLSTAWPLPRLSSRMEPEGVFLSRSEQPQQLQLNTGGFIIPHPQKVAKGGEDAFYIATNQRSFGVADGVGGWVCISFNIMLYITFLLPRYSTAYPREYIASPTLFCVLHVLMHHRMCVPQALVASWCAWGSTPLPKTEPCVLLPCHMREYKGCHALGVPSVYLFLCYCTFLYANHPENTVLYKLNTSTIIEIALQHHNDDCFQLFSNIHITGTKLDTTRPNQGTALNRRPRSTMPFPQATHCCFTCSWSILPYCAVMYPQPAESVPAESVLESTTSCTGIHVSEGEFCAG